MIVRPTSSGGLAFIRLMPERSRPPQANIPQTSPEREAVKGHVAHYVRAHRDRLVPPLVLDELRQHAEQVVSMAAIDPTYVDYTGVLLNNELWRESLASVPYDRRLLLLPKCLRVEDKCPAPFDEFGLLCKQCGLCTIQDLQEEAERLGYAVLVAEGSAIVMAMIQTGKIDAIVGVSCLSVLEKAFPYMEAAAIPGVAIPLLQDDCRDTGVDVDWVWDVIHLHGDDRTHRMDLDALRAEVDGWFLPDALAELIGPAGDGDARRVALDWLGRAGKRWRPFLTACAYRALQPDPNAPLPPFVREIAVAVECFHKASLVHDDIEDADAIRYGEPTLHETHGVAVALNAGDLLVGDGYRLLAGCAAPPDARAELIRIAADGHRLLCLGQGDELAWARAPRPLTSADVVDIFRKKTAPAFEVALRLGACAAGAPPEIHDTLRAYSDALGIAYQIRDDVEDLAAADAPDDLTALRPTLPMAIAFERAKGADREAVARVWARAPGPGDTAAVRRILEQLGIETQCRGLVTLHKDQAIRTLPGLSHASLKGLLRRVVGKIFQVEIEGWCSEFEARNAAGGARRAAAAR